MKIEYRIPQDDYIYVKGLVGEKISGLSFQRSSGCRENIVAHMVAIKMQGGGYTRICTDEWSDTYKAAIDCYRLRVHEVDNPAYAFKSKSKEPVEIETLSVQTTTIKKIDIYEFEDCEDDESVIYDVALLLVGDDINVLLGIENTSIVGDIYICYDNSKIEEKLKQYSYVRSISNA